MSDPVKKERLEVPIWHKPYLTIDEATAYTGIGREKPVSYTHLCKKVFTKQQSIWKHFSGICF